MKRLDPKHVTIAGIDGVEFHIYPFSAFRSSNILGEVSALVVPLIGALAPVAGKLDVGDAELKDLKLSDISEIDLEKDGVMDAVSDALGNVKISGSKLEALLRKLLILEGNIAVSYRDEYGKLEQKTLDEDMANEVFCQDVAGMFILAFHVISVNYGSFFRRIAAQFGRRRDAEDGQMPETTESLMQASLTSLS